MKIKILYFFTCALAAILFLMGIVSPAEAAELSSSEASYGNTAYITYTGPTKTYEIFDYEAQTTVKTTIESGTIFKLSFVDFDPAWRIIAIQDRLYVFYLDKYDITKFTAFGQAVTVNPTFAYSNNPQSIPVYVGHANQYNLNISTVNGSMISSNVNLLSQDKLWNYTFGEAIGQFHFTGIPVFEEWNDDHLDLYGSIIQTFDYSNTPFNPANFETPKLKEVLDERNAGALDFLIDNPLTYKVGFSFYNNPNAIDATFKNVVINSRTLKGNKLSREYNNITSFTHPVPDYIIPKTQDSYRYLIFDYYLAYWEGFDSADDAYQLDSIEFDICYNYPAGNSDFLHVNYNAATGEVTTSSPKDLPISTAAPSGNGYITSPSTTVTGTGIALIINDWINNLGISLQSFTNALVGIADAGTRISTSIGSVFQNVFGSTVANMVAMGIVCAVLLRILGR